MAGGSKKVGTSRAQRIPVLVAVAVTIALLALPLAPAAAQVEEPLVARIDEKTAAAQEDPAGYAAEQATEERLADDANWTIAYGCYVGHVASDEAGLPPPEVDQCAGFEEAIGIAEEERQAEEAVADAEALQDGTRAEAEAIAEDLADALDSVLDDPTEAPGLLLAFLERTIAALERIIGGIGSFGSDTLEGLSAGIGVLAKGAGHTIAAPVVGVVYLADLVADTFSTVTTGTALAIGAVGDGVSDGIAATADAMADGAATSGDAFTATTDAVAKTVSEAVDEALARVAAAVEGLFGGPSSDAPEGPEPLRHPATDVDGTTDGLTDQVRDVLDRA